MIRVNDREYASIETAAALMNEKPASFARRGAIALARSLIHQANPLPRIPDGVELKTAPATERREVKRVPGLTQEKAKATGEFTALVYLCTGAPDLDGDLIAPSAFHAGDDVVVSQWNHSAFGENLPSGRGKLRVDNNRVLVDGRFFLETTHGRDTHETVKQLGERCEWSIGYAVTKTRVPTNEERDRGVRRVILALSLFEVSPVNKGAAGEGRTGTVAIKNAPLNPTDIAQTLDFVAAKNDLADAIRERNAVVREMKALIAQTEIKRRMVDATTRASAERGAQFAAVLLTQSKAAAAPTIRWLSDAAAKECGIDGAFFTDVPGEIWVKSTLGAERAFEVGAHETFHALRPEHDEKDTLHFGEMLTGVVEIDSDPLLGDPDRQAAIENRVLVTPDLAVYVGKALHCCDPATKTLRNCAPAYGSDGGPFGRDTVYGWRELFILA
jgi:hypothetical protein